MVDKEPPLKKKLEWQRIGDAIRIPVTARCNLRCTYCHFVSDEDDPTYKPDITKAALKKTGFVL